MRHYVDFRVSGDRREIRNQLIREFLKEEPGEGTGDLCSIYIYYVENLKDGNRIFLKRPARLNKGFDFEVNVENTFFGVARKTTMPSHPIIFHDLEEKRKENPQKFLLVKKIIESIYNCEEPQIEEIEKIHFTHGYPIETILKSIKWLFIEQDMTYWNWSGRNMLYNGLKEL